MKRTAATTAFALSTIISSAAWACGPSFSDESVLFLVGVIVTIPLTLLSGLTLAVMARRWSLGFWAWLRSAIASFGATATGALVGYAIATGLGMMGDTGMAVVASTPLVTSIAYVVWIRSGRFARAGVEAEVD